MIQFLLQSGLEVFAGLTGLLLLKKSPPFYKIVLMQIMVAVLCEIIGYILKIYRLQNAWLFNIYLPFDCGLLLFSAYYFLNKSYSRFFLSGYLLFVLLWWYFFFQKGLATFFNFMVIVDGILVTISFMLVLYRAVMDNAKRLISLPIFWICTGIILYYGCCIPFFSMHEYMASKLSAYYRLKIYLILEVLNNVRYLCMTIGFIQFYVYKGSGEKLTLHGGQ